MDSVEYREQLENSHDEQEAGRSAESAARTVPVALLEALADEWERTEAYACVNAAECLRCLSFQRAVIRLRSVLAAHPADAPGEDPGSRADLVARAAGVLRESPAASPGGKAWALSDAGLLVDPTETVRLAARVAELEAEVERLRSRALGDEQCCLDTCNGGACETCPGCAAGWCVNGHDFAADPDVWAEMMSDEDHQRWWDEAREHNRGIDAALVRAEVAETRARRAEDALSAVKFAVESLPDRSRLPIPVAAAFLVVAQALSATGRTSDVTPSDTDHEGA